MFVPIWAFVAGSAVLLALGAALGVAVSRTAAKFAGLVQRLENLERHGAGQRATVDVTEVAILDLQRVFEQARALDAQMTNGLMRLAWMRNGGHPDANWNEVVTWWNKQKVK